MTKLWVLSDLHLDHGGPWPEPPSRADVAVVAGDVVNDEFLKAVTAQMPLVFVAGNHEFYGHAIAERKAALAQLPIHFLDDASVEIDGVLFIGATLWTDYGRDPSAAESARRGMNDHRKIMWTKKPWQRFLPSHATEMHERSKLRISRELEQRVGAATVVVTHHAPSSRSVHPKYVGMSINRAYYSDLDDLIEASGAALWVHGHVHNNFDYTIGNTRVLSNPRGYPGENREFNPALVVEV